MRAKRLVVGFGRGVVVTVVMPWRLSIATQASVASSRQ
jgi:hypothetical protein